MGGIKIVTDSASDLAPDLAERHDITVVPLTIRFGDTEFLDRRDLTPDEFWSRCATSPVLPETAAPSPGSSPCAENPARRSSPHVTGCKAVSAPPAIARSQSPSRSA